MIDTLTRTMSAAEAQARFDEVTRQVADTKAHVIVQLPSGRSIAIISSEAYDALLAREADDTDWDRSLRATQAEFRRQLDPHVAVDAAAMIREDRDDGDERTADDLSRR